MVSEGCAASGANIRVFLILWDTLPFLLELRKERNQLQLCVMAGAIQSVAGAAEEEEEDKSVLQGWLQYKIYCWQRN